MAGKLITINGETRTVSEWANYLGFTRGALTHRAKRFGETTHQSIEHFFNRFREERNIPAYTSLETVLCDLHKALSRIGYTATVTLEIKPDMEGK